MRDSLGGLVSIFIIVIFVVLIMGYLAFNVNYTKAFRMRDKVIDTLNRNNGVCGKYCRNEINQYAADIGYMGFDKCVHGAKDELGIDYVCTKMVFDSSNSSSTSNTIYGDKTYHYIIYTRITIDIPVINSLLKLNESLGELKGITKTFVMK